MSAAHRFVNWAATESSNPEKFLKPGREEELVEIVNAAIKENSKIRVVGAGHSWSSVACTDQWMINLDNYCNVLNIDKEAKRVTVEAGIRLKALNLILQENGLSLSNLGSISEQSIAGAISTGTHGTGIKYSILSTQILALTLINGKGELISVDREKDENLFRAALVSLGALGIISSVTIQCEEFFNLEEYAYPVEFEEGVKRIPELLRENEHMKLWWFPHVKELQVYCYNRTSSKQFNTGVFIRWVDEKILAKYVFTFLLQLGLWFPALTIPINRFIKILKFKKEHRIDYSYRVFNTPMPPKHHEAEYAIPAENAGEAMLAIRQMIKERNLYVNFLMEVRFVKADDCFLSPAYGRDTCYLGAYKAGDKGWKEYLDGFEEIMAKYNGRPHWGKEFSIDKNAIGQLYPELGQFQAIREEMDPNNVFANRFVREFIM